MDEDDNRLLWQLGLPDTDDLTPLTLQLIPSELASAFRISQEPSRTLNDVNRASENTLSSLQRCNLLDIASNHYRTKEKVTEKEDGEETDQEYDPGKKIRRVDQDAESVKRVRLVWTPQLHKRFIEVVAHLGVKNAVPKMIMELMNVEGLTRENVASHLQKYRLYLKRQSSLNDHYDHQGGSCNNESSESTSGHMFNLNGHVGVSYTQQMMPMMGYGGGQQVGYHQYGNRVQQQQREWSGNNFGYYHPVASNDK